MPRFCPQSPEEGQLLKQRILTECDKSNIIGDTRHPRGREHSKFSLGWSRSCPRRKGTCAGPWRMRRLSRQRRWEGHSRQRKLCEPQESLAAREKGRVVWRGQQAQGAGRATAEVWARGVVMQAPPPIISGSGSPLCTGAQWGCTIEGHQWLPGGHV